MAQFNSAKFNEAQFNGVADITEFFSVNVNVNYSYDTEYNISGTSSFLAESKYSYEAENTLLTNALLVKDEVKYGYSVKHDVETIIDILSSAKYTYSFEPELDFPELSLIELAEPVYTTHKINDTGVEPAQQTFRRPTFRIRNQSDEQITVEYGFDLKLAEGLKQRLENDEKTYEVELDDSFTFEVEPLEVVRFWTYADFEDSFGIPEKHLNNYKFEVEENE